MPFGSGFKTSAQRAADDIKVRSQIPRGVLSYGIPFLDKTLNGILRDELILIGAPSGAGKTQIATNIALYNAVMGKRVHFFALEAVENEIERRMVFELMAEEFYRDRLRPELGRPLNYLDWIHGRFGEKVEPYEINATAKMQDITGLSTFYKTTKSFSIDDLITNVMAIADETDLIVIDHINFFDYDSSNENAELKKIAKAAIELVQLNKKPIVLISHFRKNLKQFSELIAGLDEFHGSSDVAKISTTAITLGKGPRISDTQFETYVRVAKARYGGERARFVGKMIFDIQRNGYLDTWSPGELSPDGKEFIECEVGEEPFWLR